MNIEKIIKDLIPTFLEAGKVSLKLRKDGLDKKIKSDNTPVSNGDLEVNKILTNKIKELTPTTPVVSEEAPDNKNEKYLKDFWLVDPIDGTFDYINNLDEFTINAGLILDNKPAGGIIYAPAKKRLFYSYGINHAYEQNGEQLTKLDGSKNFNKNKINFVSYSSKLKPEIQKFHKQLNVKKYTRMKSSLKFCVIAAGEFDGYVAEARACEWDIAAGHAILQHSGGSVRDFDNQEIFYGKKDFKNPSLILKSKSLF